MYITDRLSSRGTFYKLNSVGYYVNGRDIHVVEPPETPHAPPDDQPNYTMDLGDRKLMRIRTSPNEER